MILADKIIKLRKKNGMSQEELAEKINVSRQSVSKWEGAQSIPDLDKIIQMSELFGVTTDYLLKDDIEEEEFSGVDVPTVKNISLEEANAYVEHKKRSSLIIALSTFLCIISPITLIILSGVSEYGSLNSTTAVLLGLLTLFGFVAIAVAGFVFAGYLGEPFTYLSAPFDREYGVEGAIREKKRASRPLYIKLNVIATVLCILAALPIVVCGILGKELLTVIMVGVALFVVGIAVALYIFSGVRSGGFDRLLCEGEFAGGKREKNKLKESIDSAYWAIAVAVYFGWSFISGDWGNTWIVWPIAGVLFGAFEAIVGICNKNYRDSDD
ncbi:MAG: helix-turn-helix transcriptional regulator [Clostridia bacterium]|nr:helix-turn-helix transcriptional regulator [Clostridia bacterium]